MNIGRYLRGEDRHVGTARITKPKDLKMNDRIKELIDECWVTREHCTTWFDHEKFAKLIIEECINLNGKELAMSGHSRMVDVYCEHFGIKF